MTDIYKIHELENGEFSVTEFELVKSWYGDDYIVTVVSDITGQAMKILANSYLAEYISTRRPKGQFRTIVDSGILYIPSYSHKKILDF
jgi:hypothetical protein